MSCPYGQSLINLAHMSKQSSIGSATAARILGISRSHLQRLASSGRVPADKLPGPVGAYVFDRDAVEALAKAGVR
ncbi:helix-turn-helix domain-containing protein [Gordonia malaquae]|uniref:helix-turn-helix domain-containing protein n=1 Tax=Gordonia malaquae TaxID=410332 RepID=UPI003BF8968E